MLQLADISLDLFKEIAEKSLDEFTGYIPNNVNESVKHSYSNQEVDELKKLFKSLYTQLSYSIISCEDLVRFLDAEKAEFISDSYTKNKYHLVKALLKEHNSEVKYVLNDFDWKVKWIIGSSVSTSLRYPLLELDFSVAKNCDDKMIKDQVKLELNREELDRLIAELENKTNSL